jgi:hypothetical protein
VLGGGLEPHFRVLFSAVFHVFPRGISIRVETGGSGRKQNCGLLWSIQVQSFYVVLTILCIFTRIQRISFAHLFAKHQQIFGNVD